jgi:hypothetical protein
MTRSTITIGALILLAIAAALAIPGCMDLGQYQQDVTDARKELDTLRKQATTMPADSPDRKLIEDNAKKADAQLAKAESILAAVKAAQSGDDTGLLNELAKSGIPYAGLAGALGLFAVREFKAAQVRKALTQTVQAISDAHPDHLPEPLKQSLEAAQDVSTKVLVAKVKANS